MSETWKLKHIRFIYMALVSFLTVKSDVCLVEGCHQLVCGQSCVDQGALFPDSVLACMSHTMPWEYVLRRPNSLGISSYCFAQRCWPVYTLNKNSSSNAKLMAFGWFTSQRYSDMYWLWVQLPSFRICSLSLSQWDDAMLQGLYRHMCPNSHPKHKDEYILR